VHHRLLVARLVVGQQVGVLVQRLADAGDVPVPEDAEAAGEEALPVAVAFGVLRCEKANERLRRRQPDRTAVRRGRSVTRSALNRIALANCTYAPNTSLKASM
jgi:hypothetical protein